jgi:hypothetical protein
LTHRVRHVDHETYSAHQLVAEVSDLPGPERNEFVRGHQARWIERPGVGARAEPPEADPTRCGWRYGPSVSSSEVREGSPKVFV